MVSVGRAMAAQSGLLAETDHSHLCRVQSVLSLWPTWLLKGRVRAQLVQVGE